MPYEQPSVMLSDISHAAREAHGNVEVDHEYDILDEYSQPYENILVPQALHPEQEQQQSTSAGDYEFIQCPAYNPVIYGNQQTEASLTQPRITGSTEVMAATGGKGQILSSRADQRKM